LATTGPWRLLAECSVNVNPDALSLSSRARYNATMILPASATAALALLAVSILCWGSWANLQKLTGRWRFELFYYDFSFGVLAFAILAAFTLGTLNTKELTFQDNLLVAGYRNIAFAIAAGIVFNLANMLLVGAISVAGMAAAFSMAIGWALALDTGVNYLMNLRGDPVLLSAGGALTFTAAIVAAVAWRARAPRAGKAIALCVTAGIFMAMFYPLLRFGAWSENAVGPYGTVLFFGVGVWLSTLLYNPFFMFFPVQGKPLEIKVYFSGRKREHLLGVFAGMLWTAGGLASALIAPSSLGAYQWGQISAALSALWGLFAWREFAGTRPAAKFLIAAAVVLLAAGAASLGWAYGK
jgi:glucose uptake protein